MTRFDLSRIDGITITNEYRDSLIDSVYAENKKVTSRAPLFNTKYLNCREDKGLFVRILSYPLNLLEEIGELVDLGEETFWIGENDYLVEMDEVKLDPEELKRKGYIKVNVDYYYEEWFTKVCEEFISRTCGYVSWM